ncbi:thiamine pyrophosphate-dependent enzyme [Anaeromyxobacter oryzisoli]|jgi:pyruvate ferredoxin oxidoreductase beta subunit|uniref:thiamine pyrophosphate-dependent enzyme n=1 Tax=Anaeromyxobacter oryzisoli TaxID=2925408 RepID=UPI001F57F707|nr:thiamine pyrophosphate-dependent enzyme [Anaeromyxobacter sp. SG63]
MSEPSTVAGPSAETRPTPLLRPGNSNCGGCGMSSALQLFGRAVEHRRLQLVVPASCAAVTAGPFPTTSFGVPTVLTTFGAAAAVATGLSRVARLNGDGTRVVCWAGDGGTYDIGMASLSAAAERDEDVLYVCYDNEIYGNTGGQRSSATPAGASTTNTPAGKPEEKKDLLAIMAAHRVRYAASFSIAHPQDAIRKVRRALDATGFRFLHALSPCPTGWKSEPALGIELVRLAVRSGLYPVVEIVEGRKLVVNVEPDFSREALELYLSLQQRFQRSGITAERLAPAIARRWRELRAASGRILPAEREA